MLHVKYYRKMQMMKVLKHNEMSNIKRTNVQQNNSSNFNQFQSNLVTGDIAFLLYSPDGSTRRKLTRGRCICGPILGKGRS